MCFSIGCAPGVDLDWSRTAVCWASVDRLLPQQAVQGEFLLLNFPACTRRVQAARRHADEYCRTQLGYSTSNMRFVEGHIEYLDAAGIADSSVRLLSSARASPLSRYYSCYAPMVLLHTGLTQNKVGVPCL